MGKFQEDRPWAVKLAIIVHHKLTLWMIRAAIFLLVIFFSFGHLHITHDPAVILSIILVLMFLLSEQNGGLLVLMERRDRFFRSEVERQANALKSDLSEVQVTLTRLNENMQNKLLSLRDCVESLSQWVIADSKNEVIVIEHIGLDLLNAWSHVHNFVKDSNSHRRILYKLLIITDKTEAIPGANEEVKSWSKHVKDNMLKRIIRDVSFAQEQALKSGRELAFEIRKYAVVPHVHGIRIVEPDRLKLCYVAFCRWTDDGDNFYRYDWGEPQYHRVLGGASDPAQKDLNAVFDGHFKHLWHYGTVVIPTMGRQVP